jgi:hypothetical protein
MSYVFIRYDDNSYEYFENVTTSWGDDGSLILYNIQDKKEYSWVHVGKVVTISVSESPYPDIETLDEEEEESE